MGQPLAEMQLGPWDDPAWESLFSEAVKALEQLLLPSAHARLTCKRHRVRRVGAREVSLDQAPERHPQPGAPREKREIADSRVLHAQLRFQRGQQRVDDCLVVKGLLDRALKHIQSNRFDARADRRTNVTRVAEHLRDHWYRFDDYLKDDGGDLNRAALARGIEATTGKRLDRTTVEAAWTKLQEIFRICNSVPPTSDAAPNRCDDEENVR
jgi:hypothetical protein